MAWIVYVNFFVGQLYNQQIPPTLSIAINCEFLTDRHSEPIKYNNFINFVDQIGDNLIEK